MSKAVMISIQPKWCELIARGKKTIEVRKTAPKIDTPFKVYIYQTKKKWIYKLLKKLGLYQGKVIGEFVCDKIDTYVFGDMDIPMPAFDGDSTCWEFDDGYYITNGQLEQTSLTYEELCNYGKGKPLYGLHISNLVIYDTPRELGEFKPYCNPDTCMGCKFFSNGASADTTYCSRRPLACPPQSWCYVEEVEL